MNQQSKNNSTKKNIHNIYLNHEEKGLEKLQEISVHNHTGWKAKFFDYTANFFCNPSK